MSYILEALKKSEEKRRKEELNSSRLHHLQPSPPAAASEGARRQTLLIFCAIILISALLAGGLFFSFRDGASPVTASGQNEIALQKTLQDVSANPVKVDVPVLGGGAKTVPATPGLEATETILEPAPLVAETISTLPPTKAVAAAEPAPAGVPLLEELDEAFVQTVPHFTMAGHVYSDDPRLRMILINNSVVREMDIVEQDFVIEEITPDGVIMRLDDIRFRLRAD